MCLKPHVTCENFIGIVLKKHTEIIIENLRKWSAVDWDMFYAVKRYGNIQDTYLDSQNK